MEFGQLVSTLMAGPPEAMDQEQRFLGTLSGTQRFAVDGDVLVLGDASLRRVTHVVVSGRVTYRQRIALPPGAVLVVSVLDVSRVDAPSVTVAEQRIEVEHQVPIPFEVRVDADRLDPRTTLCGGRQDRDRRQAGVDLRHPSPGGERRPHRGRDPHGDDRFLNRTSNPGEMLARTDVRNYTRVIPGSLSHPLRTVNG